jgi:hypothetical protein
MVLLEQRAKRVISQKSRSSKPAKGDCSAHERGQPRRAATGTPRALASRPSLGRPRPRAAAAQMLVPLAGGGQETLLSEVGFVLLPFFSTRDACALRLVCREFLAAVTEHPWEDSKTAIKGSIADWRASFPKALCANVAQGYWKFIMELRNTPVLDADFVHLQGLRELNMSGCTSVTDAAFAHLRGINTLNMSLCSQSAITDAAFEHLRGIRLLDMSSCNQEGITDAAFAHLRGIYWLDMRCCYQESITDAAFANLRGIGTLIMKYCTQNGITAAALAHLQGIKCLVIHPGTLRESARALGLPLFNYD